LERKIPMEKVWDIEELVEMGKQHRGRTKRERERERERERD